MLLKRTFLDLENLGLELKKLRREKKWSQDTLEKYSGITKRTISKIENGFIEEVGIKKVAVLLDLLGVELSLRPKGRPKTLEELQDDQ
ncbi:MAG: helix-turn-helix domain-containing protein [Epsilonproteobacteria bacterium]|nr:helix-turn-helix domain-containing protein [Campylobacterota bacterium]